MSETGIFSQYPSHYPLIAGELARALLHVRPPEWADEEAAAAGRPETAPAARRLAGMAALAVAAPRAGGLALAAEVLDRTMRSHVPLMCTVKLHSLTLYEEGTLGGCSKS